MEDADFIARVLLNGDPHAFGELVKRHQSLVRNLLRKWLRDDDATADDLAQETFLKAYRNLHQYQGTSSFSTWLCGVAYNEFRMWIRGRKEQGNTADVAEETTPENANRSREFRQDLRQAMRVLSLEERSAVVCCAMQGMSHAEAVQVLGWPLGTVKTHLLRGKEKLRQRLAEWAGAL